MKIFALAKSELYMVIRMGRSNRSHRFTNMWAAKDYSRCLEEESDADELKGEVMFQKEKKGGTK